MYDYVTKELPVYLMEEFPNIDTTNASLMGHSMGGPRGPDHFLQELQQVQVGLGLLAHLQPDQLPLGQEGLRRLPR